MILLTPKKLQEFFPDDNRFLHYVARKNGMFFICEDDVESARFFALENIMRMVNSKFEFEDEKHLYSVVQKNFLRATYRMIEWNQAKKNSMDIKPESHYIMTDDSQELRTYVQSAKADVKHYDNTMDLIESYAQDILDDVGYAVYSLTLSDVARKDIAAKLGITNEAVRQRQNSNVKKLKAKYDTHENDTTHLRKTRQAIRDRVRRKPVAEHKATECAYTEADAFLSAQYEIPYSFSDFE